MTKKAVLFKSASSAILPSILIISFAITMAMIQVEGLKKANYVALMSQSLQTTKIDKKAVLIKFYEAIETVGRGLNKNYFAKGYDTPEEIAPIYTPPAHDHWLKSVRFFMGVMTDIQTQNTLSYAGLQK